MSISILKSRFFAEVERRPGIGNVPLVVDRKTGDRFERAILDDPQHLGLHSHPIALKLAQTRCAAFNAGRMSLKFTKSNWAYAQAA